MSTEKQAVMITTKHRGVFFGYKRLGAPNKLPESIELTDVRMCVSWSRQMKGVLGLANVGPDENCRIGPKVPRATIYDITAVFDCTADAVARWEAAPWS